jgi:hypothetical protein
MSEPLALPLVLESKRLSLGHVVMGKQTLQVDLLREILGGAWVEGLVGAGGVMTFGTSTGIVGDNPVSKELSTPVSTGDCDFSNFGLCEVSKKELWIEVGVIYLLNKSFNKLLFEVGTDIFAGP